MERKNKEELPLWKKVSPGTLIIRKPRYIRMNHGGKYRATAEELGRRIGEFDLLEGEVDMKKFPQVADEEKVPPKEEYSIESVKGGWYNVLSPTGDVVNEKKLRAQEAEELKASLEEVQED